MELQGKPGLETTLQRFDAWWRGDMLDRAPITAWVKPARPSKSLPSQHATLRDRWLDVEWQVRRAHAHLLRHDYALDTLPVYMPNVGPEIMGALFGCELEFGEDTSWSVPILHDGSGWDTIATGGPDFACRYWQAVEAMTALSLELGAGKVLTGITDLHGNLDILASLREPVELCLDLVEHRDAVRRAVGRVAEGYVAAYDRLWRMISARQAVCVSWLPCAYRGPMYIPSCDFWCMLGPDDAAELAVPGIVAEMRPLQRSIFHLDGPQALRHLDLVLALPGLNAVQWVYGAGKGPARHWIDVYRQIRQAGKSILVEAADAADALAVLEALADVGGGRGVWLNLSTGFDSVSAAEAFGRDVEILGRSGR